MTSPDGLVRYGGQRSADGYESGCFPDSQGSYYLASAVDALIAKLREELREANESLVRVKEVNIRAAEGEPFHGEALFAGEAVKAWAQSMVEWFRQSNGKNYVTVDLTSPDGMERYEVTMRKSNGETPAQQLVAMRAELAAERARAGDAREAAMQACWNAVDDMIPEGKLGDRAHDERIGLIDARSAITALIDKERKQRDRIALSATEGKGE
jgi:hypothetical protein